MTLAEFQPYVEQALVSLEWAVARTRWRHGLLDERDAITRALPLAGSYGVEREPLEARWAQINTELQQDVTADRVSQSPLRSVPMDMIAAAVVRRILRVPPEFPVLSIRELPKQADIDDAVRAIAMRWQTPNGQSATEDTHVIESESHV